MKLLAILSLVFSFNLFAQYNDGFHSEPEITCRSGNCLFVNNSIFELITYEDIDGYEFTKMNMSADLIDVFAGVMEACYTGDQKQVHRIARLMRGKNEANYYNGGHMRVVNLATSDLDEEVAITFQYVTDYTGDSVHIRNIYVVPCESETK